MQLKEYDRVLLKDGRTGTIIAGYPNGPYSVDVGSDSKTWDNIFVNADEIEKLIQKTT